MTMGKAPDLEQDVAGKPAPLAYNVSEVHMQDGIGAIFLGILAIILLVALLRAWGRARQESS